VLLLLRWLLTLEMRWKLLVHLLQLLLLNAFLNSYCM
jgi:hypothetical protein